MKIIMKKRFTKLLLTGFICTLVWQINPAKQAQAAEVAINEQNFPDESFRKIVKSNFDNDQNGILSDEELRWATELEIDLRNVVQAEDGHYQQVNGESIEGIEYLENLQYVNVKNKLPSKGNLKKNQKLKSVSYDVDSQSTSWAEIEKFFPMNQVEYFEVMNAPKITRITLPTTDKMTTFSVKKCKALSQLNIQKAKKLTKFRMENTAVKTMDFSKNTKLTEVSIQFGTVGILKNLRSLKTEDSSVCVGMKNSCKIIFPKNNKITKLNYYTKDKKLDISSCKKLKELHVSLKTKIQSEAKWYKKNHKKLKIYGDGILQKKPTKSNKKKNVVLKLREKDDTNYKFVSEEELEET